MRTAVSLLAITALSVIVVAGCASPVEPNFVLVNESGVTVNRIQIQLNEEKYYCESLGANERFSVNEYLGPLTNVMISRPGNTSIVQSTSGLYDPPCTVIFKGEDEKFSER